MKIIALVLLASLLPLTVRADATSTEIDYLLRSIGNSDCAFVRNGTRYDARAAEEHLRMKYRRGKRYAPTSEKFVENLASKSYLSKKLYYVECEGAEKMPSGDWLLRRLGEYRVRSAEVK